MRVVSSLDELLQLPQDRGVNGFVRRDPLRLQIPAVTPPVLARAQDTLNTLQASCGSLAAAGVMFLALTFGVIKVLYRNPTLLNWRALIELAVVVGLSLALGAVAKTLALAHTRWRFARECRAQHQQLVHHLRNPGDPGR